MPKFPKIQNPCPIKSNIDQYMDGDNCRHCQSKVYNLDGMTDAERVALIESSRGDLCVSYKLPVTKSVVAVAAVASMTAMPIAAQEMPTEPVEGPCSENACAEADEELILGGLMIMVGGIKKPSDIQYIETKADTDEHVPEISVIYEDPEEDVNLPISQIEES